MSGVVVIPNEGRYDTDLSKKNPKKSRKVLYQKKGGRGPAHPSFFWYDTDSGH